MSAAAGEEGVAGLQPTKAESIEKVNDGVGTLTDHRFIDSWDS